MYHVRFKHFEGRSPRYATSTEAELRAAFINAARPIFAEQRYAIRRV
jgi:hypothetical protein